MKGKYIIILLFIIFSSSRQLENTFSSNGTNNVYGLRPDLFIMDLVKQFLEKDFTTTIGPLEQNVTISPKVVKSNKERDLNSATDNYDNKDILKIVDEVDSNNLTKNLQANCEPSDEKFLYTKLENMGGRNQGFMANSIQEAALHFSELVPEKSKEPTSVKGSVLSSDVSTANVQNIPEEIITAKQIPSLMSAPPVTYEGSGQMELNGIQESNLGETFNDIMYNDSNCDSRCQRLMKVLTEATEKQKTKDKLFKRSIEDTETSFPDDDESGEVKITQSLNKSTSFADIPCTPTQTIFVDEEECIRRGTAIDAYGSLYSLCTACSVVYVMPGHCFPKYFNGVQCSSKDNQCIYNKNSQAVYGQCLGQTLSYKVLRNIKDDLCPKWKEETVQLPIACSCALKLNPFISA
uniref:Protein spaetzle-like n=1 Tax=Parastrongyloides trichosuri TaxID=131310 RepID=A0A0N4ZY93_PARTI